MKVYWTDIAIDSLNNVYDFVEVNWDRSIADRFLELIDQSIYLIKEQPKAGQKALNTEFRSVLVHRNVSLYYEHLPGLLKIILVWDNRQNPELLTKMLEAHKE